LRTKLKVDDSEIELNEFTQILLELNEFTQILLANIIKGAVSTLRDVKHDWKNIELQIKKK